MTAIATTLGELAAAIETRLAGGRLLVAIAGAPGSGKSTLAEALLLELNRQDPQRAALVPMDGYHFDNQILIARNLLARKGAPETFNAGGLAADLKRIRAGKSDVAVPVFDRQADLARANALIIPSAARIVLVEGNYLLLDLEPWRGMADAFDLTVFLDVPEAELEARLIRRWLQHGFGAEQAKARARGNDMANAQLVIAHSRTPDIVAAIPDLK